MSTDPSPGAPIADPEALLGTYAFLPWLRQGVANAITAAPASGARASLHVELDLAGDPVTGGADLTQSVAQDVSLYGPGDILGIDPRAVIRTEPLAGSPTSRPTTSRPSTSTTRISRGATRPRPPPA